jgi:hypothetical protein
VSSTQNGESTLLMWLTLLGWQVAVERDGDDLAGVATHRSSDGSTIRVGGRAPTRDELAFQLFEAAMKIVEARGERLRRPLLAA